MKKQNTNLIEQLFELLCIQHYTQKINEIQAKEYIYDYITRTYFNPELYKTYLDEFEQWEKLNKQIIENQEIHQKARECAYHFIDQYPDIQTEPAILQEIFLAGYNEARKKYTNQNPEEQ